MPWTRRLLGNLQLATRAKSYHVSTTVAVSKIDQVAKVIRQCEEIDGQYNVGRPSLFTECVFHSSRPYTSVKGDIRVVVHLQVDANGRGRHGDLHFSSHFIYCETMMRQCLTTDINFDTSPLEFPE